MTTPLARQAGTALTRKAIEVFGGKLISLARYLILARLLTPDDFGLFAIAIVPLEVLLSATDFGMIPALVQRNETDTRVYDIAWTIGLTRAVIISACLMLAAPLLALVFAEPRATSVLRVLALRPLVGALASIRMADLERRLDFGPLMRIELVANGAGAVVSVALAPTLGVWALVAGALVAAAARVAVSYILAPHRPRVIFDAAPARALFRFGRWVFITGLVGVAGDAVLRAVIARRLGAAELGLYYLAFNLAALPNDTVSGLVVAVAFPVHARIHADLRRVATAFRASVAAMATVLCPVYAVLIVLAPSLVEHVLGPRWTGAAPILQLLSLAGVIGISYDATAPMLEGRGEPYKVTMLYAIISLAVVAFAWWLAGAYGLVGAALAWVLAQSAMLVACVIFSRQILAAPFAHLARPLLGIALASLGAAGVARVVDQFARSAALPGVVGLGASVVLAGGAAALLLWGMDARLDLGLGRDFARAFPAIAERVHRSPGTG